MPFQPSELKPITQGYLVEVSSEDRTLKDETKKDVLAFKFVDIEKKRVHTHVEWELEEDDKFESKLEAMQSRIKHIFEAFAPFPDNGIGNKAKNMKEFFNEVAEAFNTTGNAGSPVYVNKPVHIKVAYSLKYAKAGLQLPYSPNFIEPVVSGKATTLAINKKYETLTQPTSTSATDMPGAAPFNEFGGATPF